MVIKLVTPDFYRTYFWLLYVLIYQSESSELEVSLSEVRCY